MRALVSALCARIRAIRFIRHRREHLQKQREARARMVALSPQMARYHDRTLKLAMLRHGATELGCAMLWLIASTFLTACIGVRPWSDPVLSVLAVCSLGPMAGRLAASTLILSRSIFAAHDWVGACDMVADRGLKAFEDTASAFVGTNFIKNEKDALHLVKNLFYRIRSTSIKS